MRRIADNEKRCTGMTYIRHDQAPTECSRRENCLRFFWFGRGGERTPYVINPPQDCGMYLEGEG